MAHGLETLKKINNEAAAKTARTKKTPYVPWNKAETLEAGFLDRLPRITDEPKGWSLIATEGAFDKILSIRNWLDLASHETVGFAYIQNPIHPELSSLAIYRPTTAAYALGSADRK